MNTMVNIIHPKLLTKPPICGAKKSTTKNEIIDLKNLERKNDTMFQTIQMELTKPANDCNQNVIEPNSCSFQQLCNMINHLEENLSDTNIVDEGNLPNVPFKYQSQVGTETIVSSFLFVN